MTILELPFPLSTLLPFSSISSIHDTAFSEPRALIQAVWKMYTFMNMTQDEHCQFLTLPGEKNELLNRNSVIPTQLQRFAIHQAVDI